MPGLGPRRRVRFSSDLSCHEPCAAKRLQATLALTERLVTVAAFTTPLQAELVRGRLEDDGVTALVFDDEMVTADWTMSNAIGGVKVRVPESEAERALAVLAEPPPDDGEPYDGPTEAEDYAHRALTSSLVGLGFPPFQLYALYLVLKYVGVADDESARTKRRVLWALAFMVPWAALVIVPNLN